MKFVLATHNPGKLQEMSSILSSLGVEVISPGDLGIDIEVEETGSRLSARRQSSPQLPMTLVCAWMR